MKSRVRMPGDLSARIDFPIRLRGRSSDFYRKALVVADAHKTVHAVFRSKLFLSVTIGTSETSI